jgi:pimeloyl-ACP methyl ester carboxylesterase
MTPERSKRWWRLLASGAVLLLVVGALLVWRLGSRRPGLPAPGKFPEQLVYVRAEDDVDDAGLLFAPPEETAKPIAVLWIHGWGANFYSPTYVGIGRALAIRGYTTVSGNTRMHDIGNVEKYAFGGRRVRGGGYWGVASEEVRDLAAWIDLLEGPGVKKVVLVGHSAGWAAVRRYQAQSRDPRVAGLVFASGQVRAATGPADADELAQATRMIAEGNPDDLVRIPKRSFPSFVSAATFLDDVKTPPELGDFFGLQTPNAGVTRVRCPLLAFFGTNGDVGNEQDLALIKSSVERQPSGPPRVTTVMIRGADHMYAGQEDQVAATIATWADALAETSAAKDGRSN